MVYRQKWLTWNYLNLKTLIISNNHLKDLEFINIFCEQLETLWCFKNCLESLDVSGMKNLVDLNCSINVYKTETVLEDRNGRYEDVYSMRELIVEGCENLEVLDCDMNSLEAINFTSLKGLKRVSVRENNPKESFFIHKDEKGVEKRINVSKPKEAKRFLFTGSAHLEKIDYKNSNIKRWVNVLHENKSTGKVDVIDNDTDEGYWSGGEENSIKKEKTDSSPTEWEQKAYEEAQRKAKANIWSGKHLYYGTTHLDFSHMKFKAMNIDGQNYPETITHINLGDNYLHSLKIANFPNLEWLVISHNTALIWGETFIIENCPNLDINCLHHYKSADESRGTPADGREYNEETDNPLKQQAREGEKKEEINEQVKELLAKDAKDITLQDFLNIFIDKIPELVFDSLEPDLGNQFKEALVQRLEPKILELIDKTKKENLTPEQLIVELEPYKDLLFLLSEDVKAQLRSLFETTEQITSKGSISYFPFYLIFVIAGLRVGFLLLPKKKKKQNYLTHYKIFGIGQVTSLNSSLTNGLIFW